MAFKINSGVFPTMITPFTEEGNIDHHALEKVVEYYIESKCAGIFAVCQSSEMFFLDDEEKIELMSAVAKAVNGRIQIVASGHTSNNLTVMTNQLRAMVDAGSDAAVIVLNRLAEEDEHDDILKNKVEFLLKALPDLTFGVYECPYPYKRLASPQLLKWLADTERIVFIKDTCCDIDLLTKKQEAVNGTQLKIYNANTATLLKSLHVGIEGYSGIMANFHADLYTLLFQLTKSNLFKETSQKLHDFLTLAAMVEAQLYPVNAKYHMNRKGIPFSLNTRAKDASLWSKTFADEIDSLIRLEDHFRALFADIKEG